MNYAEHEQHTTPIVCPFHKRNPTEPYEGCTCGISVNFYRVGPNEAGTKRVEEVLRVMSK